MFTPFFAPFRFRRRLRGPRIITILASLFGLNDPFTTGKVSLPWFYGLTLGLEVRLVLPPFAGAGLSG